MLPFEAKQFHASLIVSLSLQFRLSRILFPLYISRKVNTATSTKEYKQRQFKGLFPSHLDKKIVSLYVFSKSYIKADPHIPQSFLQISLLGLVAEYGESIAEQFLILQKNPKKHVV